MSLTWDPSEDYEVFDGLQTVTHRSKGTRTVNDDGTVTVANTNTEVSALKRQVAHRDIATMAGILKVGDTMWEVPADVTPKVGDYLIEADSTTWLIIWVDEKPVISMWRVYARQ